MVSRQWRPNGEASRFRFDCGAFSYKENNRQWVTITSIFLKKWYFHYNNGTYHKRWMRCKLYYERHDASNLHFFAVDHSSVCTQFPGDLTMIKRQVTRSAPASPQFKRSATEHTPAKWFIGLHTVKSFTNCAPFHEETSTISTIFLARLNSISCLMHFLVWKLREKAALESPFCFEEKKIVVKQASNDWGLHEQTSLKIVWAKKKNWDVI